MGPVIRAAGVRGLADLVDSLGGDGRALFDRFGLGDPDDERLVPLWAVGTALETAARDLDCPDLGLRLAERQDHSILGPLAIALESAVTVRDAVESLSRFMFVHSDAISIEIGPDPGGSPTLFGLYYRVALPGLTPGSTPAAQGMDLALGIVHRIYGLIRGEAGYPLRGVDLPHRPAAPLSRYEEFFGVRPRFGRPDAALRIPRSELGVRSERSSELVHALAVAHLEQTYARRDPGTADRVRAVLQQSLGTPTATLAGVARLLLVHPRTLQRRLADEGTGFDDVLDEVRRDRAGHLVAETDVPLTQVAAMLGYAHQAALTRAVRRWFGTSPRALRAGGAVVLG